jgi:hypothetical protein
MDNLDLRRVYIALFFGILMFVMALGGTLTGKLPRRKRDHNNSTVAMAADSTKTRRVRRYDMVWLSIPIGDRLEIRIR